MNKNKTILIFSGLLLIFSGFIISANANCNKAGVAGPGDCGLPAGVGITNFGGILKILADVFKATYIIFFIVATFMIILAAYEYLTGADDPEKIQSSHKRLIWAAVAVAVALLSVSFNVIVKNFIE